LSSDPSQALPEFEAMAPTDFLSVAFAPSNFTSMGLLFALMAAFAVLEAIVPLRERLARPHTAPNLSLTVLTLLTGLVLGAAILVALAWLQASRFGLLNAYDVAPAWGVVVGVLALDFTTYVCHVAMHKVPQWWRYHRVHHSDMAVDVTTAFRQQAKRSSDMRFWPRLRSGLASPRPRSRFIGCSRR
jgi:sterol desaturase/sphingolipid hydroxylase (fatty acid hydroxylase superfamily)